MPYYNATADDGLGYGYEFDGLGRLIRTMNPSGEKSKIKYDPVGNVISIISANNYDETSDSGPEIRFEYDAANRLINVKDTDSNIIQLTKKENGITTTYAYDKLNRLTKENNITYTFDKKMV